MSKANPERSEGSLSRPRFVLIIEPLPGRYATSPEATVRVLRAVLKRLLRDHGMKCVSCEELPGNGDSS